MIASKMSDATDGRAEGEESYSPQKPVSVSTPLKSFLNVLNSKSKNIGGDGDQVPEPSFGNNGQQMPICSSRQLFQGDHQNQNNQVLKTARVRIDGIVAKSASIVLSPDSKSGGLLQV